MKNGREIEREKERERKKEGAYGKNERGREERAMKE